MKFLTRVLKIVFLVSLALYAGLFFRKPALPSPDNVLDAVREQEPRQEPAALDPITVPIEEFTYTLTPRYRYELTGLVVSLYDADNWLDFTHKNDPGNIKDICVAWGENIASGAYRTTKFWSGEFTCSWRWRAGEPPVVNAAASNSHLIPANVEIARRIKEIAIGDQIRMMGYLADYRVESAEGKTLYTRSTSTTRDDAGNGACEIVYVTDVEILTKGSRAATRARRYAFWSMTGSFVSLVVLGMALPLTLVKPRRKDFIA